MDALTVRTYKAVARRVLTEEVDTTIGRLTATHERHMQLLEASLQYAKLGTKGYIDHIRIVEEMENRFTELMQGLARSAAQKSREFHSDQISIQ